MSKKTLTQAQITSNNATNKKNNIAAQKAIEKIVEVKKDIVSFNIERFAGVLKDVNENKKTGKSKDRLYNFPENISPIDIDAQKTFRRKMRAYISNEIANVQISMKQFAIGKTKESETKFKESVLQFLKFYKCFFTINDFSVKSISSANDEKLTLYQQFLEIVIEAKTFYKIDFAGITIDTPAMHKEYRF